MQGVDNINKTFEFSSNKLFLKSLKSSFYAVFAKIHQMRIFAKNQMLSVFSTSHTLTSSKKSENTSG